MPSRSKAQEIGERGESLFETVASKNWVVNKQNRDYGKDFIITYIDDGTVTELRADVQVKTRERLKFNARNAASQSMRTEALRMALAESRVPLILVVVDLATSEAYFAAPFLWDDNIKERVSKQGSVAFHVSRLDRVGDAPRLREAVLSSEAVIRQRITPVVAVRDKESLLAKNNPNFQFEITASAMGENIQVMPRPGVDASFKMKVLKNSLSKFENALDTGKSTGFEAGELTVEGLSLGDGFFGRKVDVQFARRFATNLVLEARSGEGEVLGSIVRAGVLECGRKSGTVCYGITP